MKAKSKQGTTKTARKPAKDEMADVVTVSDIVSVRTQPSDDPPIATVLRNQLADLVSQLSPIELTAVISFIEHMEDIEDAAAIAAHKGEDGIDLDDLIVELGFTRDEIEETAKAEGWM